jgi:hypothetical protein
MRFNPDAGISLSELLVNVASLRAVGSIVWLSYLLISES